MVVALSTAVLALLLGSVEPAQHDTFTFGRAGGNIRAYTVTITPRGKVTSKGPVRIAHPGRKLPAKTLRRLERLVETVRFFSLPKLTRCPGSLPDFASNFITVQAGTRHRRVAVRGACSPRFVKLYKALATAVGAH